MGKSVTLYKKEGGEVRIILLSFKERISNLSPDLFVILGVRGRSPT